MLGGILRSLPVCQYKINVSSNNFKFMYLKIKALHSDPQVHLVKYIINNSTFYSTNNIDFFAPNIFTLEIQYNINYTYIEWKSKSGCTETE